jgi:recombinational DNA repair protein (RecF pathway)
MDDSSLTDDDDKCAQCGQLQNSASNLTEQIFLVNTTSSKCGHKFCRKCVERELFRKQRFLCPKCKTFVTRDKVVMQTKFILDIEPIVAFRENSFGNRGGT